MNALKRPFAHTVLACTLLLSITLEFSVRYFDLWHTLGGEMDSFMHFWWGFNIFLILVFLLGWDAKDALLGVFVWQMAWESLEIVGDIVLPQEVYMLDIFFWDGVKDTLVDLAGGFAAWGAILLLPKRKTHASPARAWMRTFTLLALPGIALGAIVTLLRGESANLLILGWLAVAAVVTTFRRRAS